METRTTRFNGLRWRACHVAAILIAAHACGGSTAGTTTATSAGPASARPAPTEPGAPSPYSASAPNSPAPPDGTAGLTPAETGPDTTRSAPAAETAGKPAPGPVSEAQRIVEAHNRHRAKHCAPPLAWSDEIAAAAQAWATRLRDANCAFQHSRGMKYGENLFFMGPAGASTGTAAVDDWYSEVTSYDFSRPGFGMDTGHFTQVVWRSTTQVGCGTARCAGGDIWVCNYYPPGNVLGQFPQNVLPTSCR